MCLILGVTEKEMQERINNNIKTLIDSKLYQLKLKEKGSKGTGKSPLIKDSGDGMTPAGLIEGWVVSEEMTLEKIFKNPSDSAVLKMLQSDFFLDLTENTFKHSKL
jgi:hypothetical protein